jgi:diguanylate cyclase (GGDEF)-like protein
MPETTSSSEISNTLIQPDKTRVLASHELIAAGNAAESAWGEEPTFVDTAQIEREHTLNLIKSLQKGQITPEQFADTVGRRMAEKVVTSEIDEITQGDNRSGGTRKSIKELVRAVRYQTTTTGFMLDLDSFKPINDQLGHLAGDQALFSAAQHIRSSVREYDIPFRWGGDEFFVTLPNTKVDDAVDSVGKRLVIGAPDAIRDQMEGMGIEIPNDITFSMGAAEDIPPTDYTNSDPEARLERLTELADKAAMISKYRGKNTATIARVIDGVDVFSDPITNEQFTAEFEICNDGSRGKLIKLTPLTTRNEE